MLFRSAFITGALLKVGPTQLRLDVRAQDTNSGQILFSDKLEGQDIQSIFSMVDRLTANIAASFLPASEVPQQSPEIEQASTSNVEAFRHYQLGVDLANQYRTVDSIREFNEAIRLDPQFALAMMQLVQEYGISGDLKNAHDMTERALGLQAHLPRYEKLRLDILAANQARDSDAVVAARRTIANEFPKDTAGVGVYGHILAMYGQEQDGEAVLRQGLAANPKDENLLNFQCYALAELGDLNGALAACDAYQAARPNDSNALDTRGDIYFRFAKDDDAVAMYRKAVEVSPGWQESSKLAIVYADQNKMEMAQAALGQFAKEASPLEREYLPALAGQFAQWHGDIEGAVADYREAVKLLAADKQYRAAEEMLLQASELSMMLGDTASALTFAQQQKLDGEELIVISILQRVLGKADAAEQSLQKFAASHPYVAGRWIETQRESGEWLAALYRGDGGAAARVAGEYIKRNFAEVLYRRAWTYLLVNDYSAAEEGFHKAAVWDRTLENFTTITRRMPIYEVLMHFQVAQIDERNGKRDAAINEYQEFLSHFETSHTKLPQVAQARAALKKLMQ